ncbi:MAG: HU family DNA-binding protein [bacterium]
MLKADIVNKIASKLGLTKKLSDQAVTLVFDEITSALKKGDSALITGFGKFEVRARKARTGVNPQDPTQKIKIPATKVPAFKAGKSLKAVISK